MSNKTKRRVTPDSSSPPAPHKAVGQRLKRGRLELGYSQRVAANKIGVTPNLYWKWEAGKKLPCIDNLLALCRTLHLSLNHLITGREDFWRARAS